MQAVSHAEADQLQSHLYRVSVWYALITCVVQSKADEVIKNQHDTIYNA